MSNLKKDNKITNYYNINKINTEDNKNDNNIDKNQNIKQKNEKNYNQNDNKNNQQTYQENKSINIPKNLSSNRINNQNQNKNKTPQNQSDYENPEYNLKVNQAMINANKKKRKVDREYKILDSHKLVKKEDHELYNPMDKYIGKEVKF